MTCQCDGRYEGCHHRNPCGRDAGGRWSPYFCVDCDVRRMASITASLAKLHEDLTRRSQGR